MLIYPRKELKRFTKNTLDGRWGKAMGAFLLALAIPYILIYIISLSMSIMSVFCFGTQAWVAGVVILLALIVLLLALDFLIFGPLSVGYTFFTLRLVRGMEVKATMPFQCFDRQYFGRFVRAFFMYNLFLLLWSLFYLIPVAIIYAIGPHLEELYVNLCLPLMIPVVIKGLSYGMMFYVMMDHPEMGWRQSLNESKRMMSGHKWDLFVMQLSFIPWYLFMGVTLCIGAIYVGPYYYGVIANFYRALKEEAAGLTQKN